MKKGEVRNEHSSLEGSLSDPNQKRSKCHSSLSKEISTKERDDMNMSAALPSIVLKPLHGTSQLEPLSSNEIRQHRLMLFASCCQLSSTPIQNDECFKQPLPRHSEYTQGRRETCAHACTAGNGKNGCHTRAS
mmetsp:Transcript_45620/g.89868  ORF Transcript_45620/g.89868 Transcript_45620/m.89868 type:complete len:133 (+) Transcript_45620:2833-3231(+)